MPEGAEKGNGEYLCQGHQNGQRILEEEQAVAVEMQQAQNLSCERDNNGIGKKASITHSFGRGRQQYLLP